jgi:DUF4097 and DUF4098 domain-containing protein YvlB
MKTFDTTQPISAIVDLAMGAVRITTDDTDVTTVDVRPSDAMNDEDVRAADQTRVDFANDRLQVKGPKLRSWLSRKGGSIDVVISLPTGSHLDASAGMGDVNTNGRLGDCRIRTGLGQVHLDEVATLGIKSGAGTIAVERASGSVDISSGSGAVRVGELEGIGLIKNSNGETWVGVANRDLQVKAANGSIAVGVAHADVSATSANGSVRVGEVERGSINLQTSMGDLEIGIRDGVAAWVDANATAGTVQNTLEASGAPDASAETVEVTARTTVGEILIRKAS